MMRDFDVRTVLRTCLLADHADDPDTVILEELGLRQGGVRVDVAVLNGIMHGFEIKSERDNLDRLPRQKKAYEECFDAVTMVVAERHVKEVEDQVPKGWGIWVARMEGESVVLHALRQAESNSSVKAEAIVELLWREEALGILRELGCANGLHKQPRRILWQALVETLACDQLRDTVRETIKARGDWRVEKRLAQSNGSSPTASTEWDPQESIRWLASLAQKSLDHLC